MSDKFNEEDWMIDYFRGPVEDAFLNSEFPQKFEAEIYDTEPSEIDSEYYEVDWVLSRADFPKAKDDGLLIAFIPKALYQEAFGSIGEPPDQFAQIWAEVTVLRRDQPNDKKSHPNLQCWLEATDATFLRWKGDDDQIEDYEDEDDDEDPVEISAELGDPNQSIGQKLESLLIAFEEKGAPGIRESMLPALSVEEIKQRTDWFPANLPQPVIELYQWANGQASDPWNEKSPFWFRDMGFLSLENAKTEYESMMASYGVDNNIDDDGVLLATSFPIAAFNGGWYVVPAEKHALETENAHPVVCVLEGIDMQYHSVAKMLDTCSEWVRYDSYNYESAGLNENVEQAIWVKHNPGIFDD